MNNFHMLSMGKRKFYFSYETVIAVEDEHGTLVMRENDWGTATGKHMNYINPNKSFRINGIDFENMLEMFE